MTNDMSVNRNPTPVQQSLALVEVKQNEFGGNVESGNARNPGLAQSESIVSYSKTLENDLKTIGMKLKQHEDNIKFMNSQKYKLDDSILDLQVNVGKYHSTNAANPGNGDQIQSQLEEEIIERISRYEKSAAGALCLLKIRHSFLASQLPLVKDMLGEGIVALLGKVDDDNLSRLFSEFLGLENMMAIVCKTYNGVRALEEYNQEGCIEETAALHGLTASVGRNLKGRFVVFCLENLRPYLGDFVSNDPQRRLDLLNPKFPDGECPPGFLGFAVNMITLDVDNLLSVTAGGHGLRETLFYNLFSRLQVYKTRADMLNALPCISDGAVSLDGGMIRASGVFSLGYRQDLDIKFPKSDIALSPIEKLTASERQIRELKWKRETMSENIQRERALLENTKLKFDKKKAEFIKFIADSSSFVDQQHQIQAAQSRPSPR